MDYVILDLEWNGAFSHKHNKFINEIIEFGAVKLDKNLNKIGTFSHLVKPKISAKITSRVQSLTSITTEQVRRGSSFLQVASRFQTWMGDSVVMTWGIADILTLMDNFQYHLGEDANIPFLKKYVNLQDYCVDSVNCKNQKLMGLSSLADYLAVYQKDIQHHRALDDSILTWRCLQKTYKKERFDKYIQIADDSFFERVTFKNITICDLSNPLISRSDMTFRCDLCGDPAHRESDWLLKNKSYRAPFRCRTCKARFMGRVRFRLKYDGMEIKKSTAPIEEVAVVVKQDKKPKKKEPSVVKVSKKKLTN